MRMLAKAVNRAKSDDPKAIAPQLEAMTAEGFDGGEIAMRKDDEPWLTAMHTPGPHRAASHVDTKQRRRQGGRA